MMFLFLVVGFVFGLVAGVLIGRKNKQSVDTIVNKTEAAVSAAENTK